MSESSVFTRKIFVNSHHLYFYPAHSITYFYIKFKKKTQREKHLKKTQTNTKRKKNPQRNHLFNVLYEINKYLCFTVVVP